jgi:uncharacterized protein YjbI with pentapeptide repeats
MASHQKPNQFQQPLTPDHSTPGQPPNAGGSQHWQWMGFQHKTLWNFLELLMLPIILIVGLLYLEHRATRRQEQLTTVQTSEQQQVAQTAIAQSQQLTLQNYLDQIAIDLDQGLLTSAVGSNQRNVARARTLVTLEDLDPDRRQRVIQFLYETRLISGQTPVISLSRANFNNVTSPQDFFPTVNLREALLNDTDFNNTNFEQANFEGANLQNANLSDAFLFEANLSQAILTSANLSQSILIRSNLSSANLDGADLSGAFLVRANLQGANLRGADLTQANLNEANLTGAFLDDAALTQTFLCKTVMPDGEVVNRDCP